MTRQRMCSFIALCSVLLSACSQHGPSEAKHDELAAFASQNAQSAASQPQDFSSYWAQVEHLPPASSNEEYQSSFMDAAQKYSDCMEERGWPRPVVDDPYTPFASIVEEATPLGQEAEKFEDEKACLDFSAPWPQSPELTREYLAEEYARLEDFRRCIAKEGGEISELPTREKYVEDVLGGGNVWSPMEELRKSGFWSGKQQGEIFQLCPW